MGWILRLLWKSVLVLYLVNSLLLWNNVHGHVFRCLNCCDRVNWITAWVEKWYEYVSVRAYALVYVVHWDRAPVIHTFVFGWVWPRIEASVCIYIEPLHAQAWIFGTAVPCYRFAGTLVVYFGFLEFSVSVRNAAQTCIQRPPVVQSEVLFQGRYCSVGSV